MVKLYISNINPKSSEETFRNLFETYGEVTEVAVIRKGFAFVHMENYENALKAISSLNSKIVDGKPILVRISCKNNFSNVKKNLNQNDGRKLTRSRNDSGLDRSRSPIKRHLYHEYDYNYTHSNTRRHYRSQDFYRKSREYFSKYFAAPSSYPFNKHRLPYDELSSYRPPHINSQTRLRSRFPPCNYYDKYELRPRAPFYFTRSLNHDARSKSNNDSQRSRFDSNTDVIEHYPEQFSFKDSHPNFLTEDRLVSQETFQPCSKFIRTSEQSRISHEHQSGHYENLQIKARHLLTAFSLMRESSYVNDEEKVFLKELINQVIEVMNQADNDQATLDRAVTEMVDELSKKFSIDSSLPIPAEIPSDIHKEILLLQNSFETAQKLQVECTESTASTSTPLEVINDHSNKPVSCPKRRRLSKKIEKNSKVFKEYLRGKSEPNIINVPSKVDESFNIIEENYYRVIRHSNSVGKLIDSDIEPNNKIELPLERPNSELIEQVITSPIEIENLAQEFLFSEAEISNLHDIFKDEINFIPMQELNKLNYVPRLDENFNIIEENNNPVTRNPDSFGKLINSDIEPINKIELPLERPNSELIEQVITSHIEKGNLAQEFLFSEAEISNLYDSLKDEINLIPMQELNNLNFVPSSNLSIEVNNIKKDLLSSKVSSSSIRSRSWTYEDFTKAPKTWCNNHRFFGPKCKESSCVQPCTYPCLG